MDEIGPNRESLDQDTRRKKIMELYTEGKISASQRKMLEERISQHYKTVSDSTNIENDESVTTTSSPLRNMTNPNLQKNRLQKIYDHQ
jgi:hypothetical protein